MTTPDTTPDTTPEPGPSTTVTEPVIVTVDVTAGTVEQRPATVEDRGGFALAARDRDELARRDADARQRRRERIEAATTVAQLRQALLDNMGPS